MALFQLWTGGCFFRSAKFYKNYANIIPIMAIKLQKMIKISTKIFQPGILQATGFLSCIKRLRLRADLRSVSPWEKIKREATAQAARPKARWRGRLVFLTFPREKRAGEGMGAWGEELQERLSFGKAGPSRASSDRMAAAGRARCDEGMGIDSRDEGFPFPPNNLRIVLTGPKDRHARSRVPRSWPDTKRCPPGAEARRRKALRRLRARQRQCSRSVLPEGCRGGK